MLEDVGKPPEVVCELKSEVESFRRKLEVDVSVELQRCGPIVTLSRNVISLRCVTACQSMEHLSWMGLFKEDGDLLLSKLSPKSKMAHLSVEEKHQQVRKRFLNMR